MRRARLSVAVIAALALAGGLTLLDGCPAPTTDSVDRLCTPGAFVYCRCASRAEGTKLCSDAGNAFADCNCGEHGSGPPAGYLTEDAGHERIDAALPPDAGPSIDPKCGGKLAVIASTEEEDPQDTSKPLNVYGAAYQADGTWVVGKSKGGPLRGPPRAGLVGPTLVVVWQSLYQLIGWTKFDVNQKDVLPFLSLGNAITPKSPAFVGAPASGRVYSLGVDDQGAPDDTLHEGVYSPASNWDEATATVTPGTTPVAGKSAPAAALVGTNYVLAFAGADGSLAVQEQPSGTWGAPAAIATAAVAADSVPAMTSLVGGTDELLLVYIGSDFALHWTSRKAGDTTWGAPAIVDPGAVPEGDPAVAAMSKGRAMLVWKAINGSPFYSVYDPSQTPVWTPPRVFFLTNNPVIQKPPSIATGNCASSATSAYVDQAGSVFVALYTDQGWGRPYLVPGLTKMTWTGAGEVP